MAAKLDEVEPERWNDVEKQILIQTLDHHWKEHLATLDALRQVIHLRSYAQKKPIDEYKQEAFLLFERLLVVDPRGSDPDADARAGPDRGSRRRRCCRTSSPSTSIRSRATTTRPTSMRRPARSCRTCRRSRTSRSRRCRSASRRRGRRSAGQPQRALPVRVGPEIQALPRAARAKPAPAMAEPIDRIALRRAYRADEEQVVARAASAQARLTPTQRGEAAATARALVKGVRAHKPSGRRRLPPGLRPRLATRASP